MKIEIEQFGCFKYCLKSILLFRPVYCLDFRFAQGSVVGTEVVELALEKAEKAVCEVGAKVALVDIGTPNHVVAVFRLKKRSVYVHHGCFAVVGYRHHVPFVIEVLRDIPIGGPAVNVMVRRIPEPGIVHDPQR